MLELSEFSIEVETSSSSSTSNRRQTELSECSDYLKTSSLSSSSNLQDSDSSIRQRSPILSSYRRRRRIRDLRSSVIDMLRDKKQWIKQQVFTAKDYDETDNNKINIPLLFAVLDNLIFCGNKSLDEATVGESEEDKKRKELGEEYKRFVSVTNSQNLDRSDHWDKMEEIYECIKEFLENRDFCDDFAPHLDQAVEYLKKIFTRRFNANQPNTELLLVILHDLMQHIFQGAKINVQNINGKLPNGFHEVFSNLTFIDNRRKSNDAHFLTMCWQFYQHIAILVDTRRLWFWKQFFYYCKDHHDYTMCFEFKDVIEELWQRISGIDKNIRRRLESRIRYDRKIEILSQGSTLNAISGSELTSSFLNQSELLAMWPKKRAKKYCVEINQSDFYYNSKARVASYSTYSIGEICQQLLIENSLYGKIRRKYGANISFKVGTAINFLFYINPHKILNFLINRRAIPYDQYMYNMQRIWLAADEIICTLTPSEESNY